MYFIEGVFLLRELVYTQKLTVVDQKKYVSKCLRINIYIVCVRNLRSIGLHGGQNIRKSIVRTNSFSIRGVNWELIRFPMHYKLLYWFLGFVLAGLYKFI